MSQLTDSLPPLTNSAPYSHIQNAEFREAVENSLLGDEIETQQPEQAEHEESADLTEQIAESFVDHPEQEQEQYEAPAEQVEDVQQPAELTPQAIQQGIEQLDQAVTAMGLNDELAAKTLAYELTAPFGTDPAGIDHQALGSTMAKMTLSAVQIFNSTYGDPANVAPIPRDAAVAFTNDFLRSWGIDPRNSSVNPEQFSSVMLAGAMNFLDAVNTYGVNASMDRLNSAEGAQWFADAVHKCFGLSDPVTRERALAIADAGGKYMLSVLKKLGSQAQQQPQPRASRSARSSQQQKSTRARSRFKSNQDIFDEDTISLVNSRL